MSFHNKLRCFQYFLSSIILVNQKFRISEYHYFFTHDYAEIYKMWIPSTTTVENYIFSYEVIMFESNKSKDDILELNIFTWDNSISLESMPCGFKISVM